MQKQLLLMLWKVKTCDDSRNKYTKLRMHQVKDVYNSRSMFLITAIELHKRHYMSSSVD